MTFLRLKPSYTPFFGSALAPWQWPEDLEEFFRAPLSMIREPLLTSGDWRPALDLLETDDAYVVQVDLPGVSEESIDLSLDGEVLTVSGERKPSDTKREYIRCEMAEGTFRHQVRLPSEVDADAIDAMHTDGVLTVTLRKRAVRAPHRIEIATATATA